MQPWRSGKVEERKAREEQDGNRFGGQHQSNTKRWNSSSSSSKSSISSSPMRQARLKPLPSSSSSNVPLELLSSPSRGLLAGTDASQDLTNIDTQGQFRSFISDKIQDHVAKFGAIEKEKGDQKVFCIPRPSAKQGSYAIANGMEDQSKQSLQGILLFIRRLREGCVAADRNDEFVLDVYVLSTLLSIVIGDNIQLNSSLPRLVGLIDLMSDNQNDGKALIGEQANQDIQLIISGKRNSDSKRMRKDCYRSLLLLYLCISGGETERLGGQQRKSRPGTSLEYHQRKQKLPIPFGESIKLVLEVNTSFARDDIFRLRRMMLELQRASVQESPTQFWQFALLQRSINEIRSRVWHTLKKSYMHLAVDPKLVGSESSWPTLAALAGSEDWAEKLLLVDIEVMPLNEEERRMMNASNNTTQDRSDVPDSWDESVEELTSALQSTSLSMANSDSLSRIRAKRLAEIFDVFELPQTNENQENGLDRWKDRVVIQAGAPVVKLR